MGIVNRSMDASEQKETISVALSPVATSGGTYLLAAVPYQCEVTNIAVSANGLSNTPSMEVEAYKFSGGVTINSDLSTAIALPATATSGIFALTLGTAGSTQVQLDAGEMLVARVTGANGAAASATVNIVVRKLQDIVTTEFGV